MPVTIVVNDPDFPPRAAYTVADYAYGHQVLRGCTIIDLLGVNFIIDPHDAPLGIKLRAAAAALGLKVDDRDAPAPCVATLYATTGLLAPDGTLYQGDHILTIEWLTGQTQKIEELGYLRLRSSGWEVALFVRMGGELTSAQYDTLCRWFEARGDTLPLHILSLLYPDTHI